MLCNEHTYAMIQKPQNIADKHPKITQYSQLRTLRQAPTTNKVVAAHKVKQLLSLRLSGHLPILYSEVIAAAVHAKKAANSFGWIDS